MPITIISVGFSIYTLILISTLVLWIRSTKEKNKTNKKLLKEGILTQARIHNVSHPKNKKYQADILDDQLTSVNDIKGQIIISYQYEVENAASEITTTTATQQINLDFRNIELEKSHYPVGKLIDIFYLKDDPTISNIAKHVRLYKANDIFLFINIVALASSLFGLYLSLFIGLPNIEDTTQTSINILGGFLMHLFLLFGGLLILFVTFLSTKDYIQLHQLKKRGKKTTGSILNSWIFKGSKGSKSFHIQYTYPAIAPFSLEKTINEKLYYQIQKHNELEILYFDDDKFKSDLVANKNAVYYFWGLLIFSPFLIIFLFFSFYEFVFKLFF